MNKQKTIIIYDITETHIRIGENTPTDIQLRVQSVSYTHLNDTVQEQNEDEEEELEDPQQTLKNDCSKTKKCHYLNDLLLECNERVNSRVKTKETCEQELYDFVQCVDNWLTWLLEFIICAKGVVCRPRI